MFFYTLISLFALCSQPAWSKASSSTTTYVTQYCTTNYGPSQVSRPLPRTTSATTTHSHVTIITSTSTPVTTTTPATSTTTSTTTFTSTTTLPIVTDTFTTTETTTSVATEVDTTTSTTTVYSTMTFTSAIPFAYTEAPGFTAIQSEPAVTSAGTPARMKRRALKDRANLEKISIYIFDQAPTKHPLGQASIATVYPTAMTCDKTVTLLTMTYTSTTGPTSTVTATTPISTTVVTTTQTSTVTLADASTTVTSTTTVMSTTTSVFTSSSTTTSAITTTSYVPSPQSTYAVCEDSANYLSSINGNPITLVGFPNGYTTGNGTDRHDCCVQCARMKTCGTSTYNRGFGECFFAQVNGTCDPTQQSAVFFTSSTGKPFSQANNVLSNSNCGQFGYGGQFQSQ